MLLNKIVLYLTKISPLQISLPGFKSLRRHRRNDKRGVLGFGCGLQSRNQTQLHGHFERCR
jgi:hypothetical protein